ncbi:hypothetical protein LXL04_006528 [Taraxacum kok-saghyz]
METDEQQRKKSALLSRGIQVQNEADEDTNQDVHSPPRRRSKRYINLTDKLRSPNFIRVIDPNSGLKSIESRVSGMIFAGIGDPWDLLFQSIQTKHTKFHLSNIATHNKNAPPLPFNLLKLSRDVSLKDEDEDSDDQQVQLDDLRRKYVTKMMTSDLNNLKASVYSYLPKYDELPLDKKMEMDTDKHFDRMQTRIAFLD